jgi:hypothetical protein
MFRALRALHRSTVLAVLLWALCFHVSLGVATGSTAVAGQDAFQELSQMMAEGNAPAGIVITHDEGLSLKTHHHQDPLNTKFVMTHNSSMPLVSRGYLDPVTNIYHIHIGYSVSDLMDRRPSYDSRSAVARS